MVNSQLSCVYLNVSNLDSSIDFYRTVLEKEVEVRYKNRWAQFRICEHFTLGLLCPAFDKAIIESGQDLSLHYC
ncbi:MAG: VOC family protein [Promethearchaeota archaeon]